MAYRVGIVGTGGIARAHGNACQQIEEAELVAIYDVSEEQLAKYGEEFGIEARYTDLDEMLAKEALDIKEGVDLELAESESGEEIDSESKSESESGSE